MNAQAHFQTLARYNVWATDRLFSAVAVLEDDAYRAPCGLFFTSIHGTLNHLLVAEHLLWRKRFSEAVLPQVQLNDEVEGDRRLLAAAIRLGAAAWSPLIATWDEDRFDGQLRYTNTRGQLQTLPFAATLSHVFNHATHHRGQITAALHALGVQCPELDLVYLLQEESTR